MGRAESTRSDRIELRATPEEKALLARAASQARLDLTSFVLGAALPAARKTLDEAERIVLSRRDALRVLELLDHPPPPTRRLLRAARSTRRR